MIPRTNLRNCKSSSSVWTTTFNVTKMSLTIEYRENFAERRFSSLHVCELRDICQVLAMTFARRSILHPSGGSESSSLFPFLSALFHSLLILKGSNYGDEITKQLKLTPDLSSLECCTMPCQICWLFSWIKRKNEEPSSYKITSSLSPTASLAIPL